MGLHTSGHTRKKSSFSTQDEHLVLLGLEALTDGPQPPLRDTLYLRNSPTTPTMDRTTPPISIHIALSVGEPVKKRAMSELNDCAALTPKMSSRIPPASSASATALCMFYLSCCQRPAQRGLSAAGKRASTAGQVTLVQCSALFKTNEVRVARQDLPPLSGFIHSCRCVTPSASTAQSSRSKVVPGGLKLYS